MHLTYIDEESQETKLSAEYQFVIEEIFHQLDLDESGSLSRSEFNLYNWRTSNMELSVSNLVLKITRLHGILFFFKAHLR